MEFDKDKQVENFIKKCKEDLDFIKKELGIAIIENNTQNISFYAYKYTLCEEIYDMFKVNRGGVGYFVRLYGILANPLMKIFDDTISYFTEPKLVTENKLYKVIDKIMEKENK